MTIHEKLLEIQKRNVFIPKTGKNPFTKSNYRKLEDILTVIKPILTELKILLIEKNEWGKVIVNLIDAESWELVT